MVLGHGLLVAGGDVGVDPGQGQVPAQAHPEPGPGDVLVLGGAVQIEMVGVDALDGPELRGQAREGQPELGVDPDAQAGLLQGAARGVRADLVGPGGLQLRVLQPPLELEHGAHPDDAVVGGDDQAMAGVESLLGQQVPCAREQRLRQVLALGERHLQAHIPGLGGQRQGQYGQDEELGQGHGSLQGAFPEWGKAGLPGKNLRTIMNGCHLFDLTQLLHELGWL